MYQQCSGKIKFQQRTFLIMQKLKIAIGTTLHKKITKDSTGGTEIFAYLLVSELVKRGHDVTVFASSDSSLPGKLVGIGSEEENNRVEQAQRLFYGYQLLESQEITGLQNDFDIIHINYFEPFLFMPFSRLIKKAVLYSVHSDLFVSPAWQKLAGQTVKPADKFVFVSKSAHDLAEILQNKTFVYNGIDLSVFPYSESHDNYLLWLGRIRRKKGIKEAVEAAIAGNERLIISGVIDNPEEEKFFNEEVKPEIEKHPNIEFIGPADHAKKVQLYSKAKAFLFPVTWDEPFGLTMVEAMACGTPVIGFNRGAVPEIINDGENGYVVKDVAEMVEKIKVIDQISRPNCRKSVEEKFTVEKMVDGYEKVYQEIINK